MITRFPTPSVRGSPFPSKGSSPFDAPDHEMDSTRHPQRVPLRFWGIAVLQFPFPNPRCQDRAAVANGSFGRSHIAPNSVSAPDHIAMSGRESPVSILLLTLDIADFLTCRAERPGLAWPQEHIRLHPEHALATRPPMRPWWWQRQFPRARPRLFRRSSPPASAGL